MYDILSPEVALPSKVKILRMTFSAGIRGCIEWRFAVMELQSVVTKLLSNFEFSVPMGAPDIQPVGFCTNPHRSGEGEGGTSGPTARYSSQQVVLNAKELARNASLRSSTGILDTIIDELQDDKKSLLKASLVCKALYPRTRVHLFSIDCWPRFNKILAEALSVPAIEHDDGQTVYHVWVCPAAIDTKVFYGCANDRCEGCGSALGANDCHFCELCQRKDYSLKMPAPGLPPEILDAIIDELQDDTKSLLQVSLACKALCPRTRIHLFSVATMSSYRTESQCDRLRKLITLSPKLVLHFKTLHIAIEPILDGHVPGVYGPLTIIESLVHLYSPVMYGN
ncbi:uncharacterized protein ARMOST_21925 [Armillaria ostoyae]|uniref:Uncharacterized protein n=1 Tax=Armillaria ostoyae TaxID=47428 RepID=A0A284SBJ2_ARMOS|nr:uncharacterized protein ARMOST_21925 [Armillaria ostoyae]